MQKCPVCGGTAENGICPSCGHIADDVSFEWSEMDGIGTPSADADKTPDDVRLEPELTQASDMFSEKYQPKPKKVEKFTPPSSNFTHITAPAEEPEDMFGGEPQDAFSIFVSGAVTEIKRHWWKALLIFFVPASAIIFGVYYFAIGGARRHRFMPVDPERISFKSLGIGLLYMVIGFGLIFSGWDPFGLSAWLMSHPG